MPCPDHHAVTPTVAGRTPMDAAAKNKFTPHSSCRRMATSSLRIQALTVPTGTRRYFDQFAFFYFFHDHRFHDPRLSSRSTEKQLSPGSIRCRASLFGASGVRVVRRVRRHVEKPYVEVIRRAHLADGVFERIVRRHRSERAQHVTRMIRTMRAAITMREVELGQRFTRVTIGVALAAVVGWLGVAIVLLRLAVVVLGILPTTVALGVVAHAVFRVVVASLARNVVSRTLYQLENAAQDRHGFAPPFGFATGTCLVRVTAPLPLLSPTHVDGCSDEKKLTPHSSCRRMATSSLRIQALTVPSGTRRYLAISSCVRPSMIARSRLARRFGSS